MAQAAAGNGQSNTLLAETSFLYGANAAYIEELFDRYSKDPASVPPDWRDFFGDMGEAISSVLARKDGPSWQRPARAPDGGDLVHAFDGNWPEAKPFVERRVPPPGTAAMRRSGDPLPLEIRQATLDSLRAIMLIRLYRVRGHLNADLDPLALEPPKPYAELEPATYGFGPEDMDRSIFLGGVLGFEQATMRQILEVCRRTYCGKIGYQFMHISSPEQKAWIQERVEGPDKDIVFTPEGKKAILNKLVEAEGFEKFCGVKFTGTKRFGLDGAEAVIPALEQIIKKGGQLGATEVAFGMAHRGRLNVLANVLQKPYRAIFNEFQGGSSSPADVEGSGDVKYHLGVSSDRTFDGVTVHLSLAANPSHLEAVNPVVLGKTRVKQLQHGKGDLEIGRGTVIPVLLHGDAAFAGQGVVAECFAMSGTKGYRTGGTVHIIVNNQIGFTTAPAYARSSPYPSDVALMVQAPIFHVNGDDPEAVVHCARVATEFRQRFRVDVVIDVFCYRRFGHNEGDEPSFTQPLMYKKIRQQTPVLELYARRLTSDGLLSDGEAKQMVEAFNAKLNSEFEVAKGFKANKADWFDGQWAGFRGAPGEEERRGETGVPIETLRKVGAALTSVPSDFHLHKTLKRLMEHKADTIQTGKDIDWATAEALAFGSLLVEKFPIRLAGQDCSRGTFSQRHSVLVDQENETRYTPLENIDRGNQAPIEIIDSLLSEYAALGFEYGYCSAEPRALVLWEAQFGDFANGAQVIIDQFIASGEKKWLRANGLVMLLPHGYEGQGPEHSSARLERFLQLCAEDNLQVANCSTPANYFHILRRQIHRNFRKPLILMTPKSLLRHKRCVSLLEEMAAGSSFHRVLWDDAQRNPGSTLTLQPDDKIKRVVLCSGKVYYDLLEEREKRGIDNIYLMRVEQFYPFPAKSLMTEVGRFRNAEVVWCQEEPKNMGAWTFMAFNLEWLMNRMEMKQKQPRYAGRPAAASPAVGRMSDHLKQLAQLMEEALA